MLILPSSGWNQMHGSDSEDFSRDQSYVETYRYSTYFLPSLELALRILCILEPLFMFGAFEKI